MNINISIQLMGLCKINLEITKNYDQHLFVSGKIIK